MSDFSSLLDNFKQSANKRKASDNLLERESVGDPVKRRRRTNRIDAHSANVNIPPDDIDLLDVKISFLVIGAQKASTTWLYEMLKQIPGVGLARVKEVHFWDWNRRKGLAWYSRQFPSTNPEGTLLGEITPCYMCLEERHIREIHHLFPKARIIFVARDLVDRAWSALTMELRNNARGLRPGAFDVDYSTLDDRTRNKLERESNPNNQSDSYFMNRLRHATHTDRSDYAKGLRRWLKYFSKEQILILSVQGVWEEPKSFLKKVIGHIGVKGGEKLVETLKDVERRINAGILSKNHRDIRESLRKKMEMYLAPFASDFNKLLKELGHEWRLNDYGYASMKQYPKAE